MVKDGYGVLLLIKDGAYIDYSGLLMLTTVLDQTYTKAEIHLRTLTTKPMVEDSQLLPTIIVIIKIDQQLLKFMINHQHFI